MRTVGGIILMLISLFCGGCSLFFSVAGAGSSGFGSVVFAGFLISALAGFAAFGLLKAPATDASDRSSSGSYREEKDDRLR